MGSEGTGHEYPGSPRVVYDRAPRVVKSRPWTKETERGGEPETGRGLYGCTGVGVLEQVDTPRSRASTPDDPGHRTDRDGTDGWELVSGRPTRRGTARRHAQGSGTTTRSPGYRSRTMWAVLTQRVDRGRLTQVTDPTTTTPTGTDPVRPRSFTSDLSTLVSDTTVSVSAVLTLVGSLHASARLRWLLVVEGPDLVHDPVRNWREVRRGQSDGTRDPTPSPFRWTRRGVSVPVGPDVTTVEVGSAFGPLRVPRQVPCGDWGTSQVGSVPPWPPGRSVRESGRVIEGSREGRQTPETTKRQRT